MKAFIHFLWLLAAFVWLSGCQKDNPKTSIDYYITANQSEEYDLLSFNLLWTSADTKGTSRSVYL